MRIMTKLYTKMLRKIAAGALWRGAKSAAKTVGNVATRPVRTAQRALTMSDAPSETDPNKAFNGLKAIGSAYWNQLAGKLSGLQNHPLATPIKNAYNNLVKKQQTTVAASEQPQTQPNNEQQALNNFGDMFTKALVSGFSGKQRETQYGDLRNNGANAAMGFNRWLNQTKQPTYAPQQPAPTSYIPKPPNNWSRYVNGKFNAGKNPYQLDQLT